MSDSIRSEYIRKCQKMLENARKCLTMLENARNVIKTLRRLENSIVTFLCTILTFLELCARTRRWCNKEGISQRML